MNTSATSEQDRLFTEAIELLGPALGRLALGYEADAELRRDLVQDIQVGLWRSLARFDGRCALSTWTWRVAHNRAASYVLRQRRRRVGATIALDAVELVSAAPGPEAVAGDRRAIAALRELIGQLGPPDRQVMLLYLEDLPAAEIETITGVPAAAVARKVHRFKQLLTKRFAYEGDST